MSYRLDSLSVASAGLVRERDDRGKGWYRIAGDFNKARLHRLK